MIKFEPYPLNCFSFFLGDADRLSTGRHGRIFVHVLTQQLQELIGVRTDQLRELRITGTDLL